MIRSTVFLLALVIAGTLRAGTLEVSPTPITEWKAVYGEIQPREAVPARARIGGTVVALNVTEGDTVTADARIAMVRDEKQDFRLNAIDAQLDALASRLETAEADLNRGVSLRERGVITEQRLEQLRTEVSVLRNEVRSAQADRRVIEQQVAEGEVISPLAGVVLDVPVTRGSVINQGEVVAQIGGGGVFLRLALPERHAEDLAVGDEIRLGTETGADGRVGRLAKLYPRIEGGRVLADVEVDSLDDRFVGRRVPVRLPVGTDRALLVPRTALRHEAGLDFVTITYDGDTVERSVVPGRSIIRDGAEWVEILTGLHAGETVVTPDE